MLRLKRQVFKIHPEVFHWFHKNGLYGIFAVHVDDFLCTGSDKFEKDIKHQNLEVYLCRKRKVHSRMLNWI